MYNDCMQRPHIRVSGLTFPACECGENTDDSAICSDVRSNTKRIFFVYIPNLSFVSAHVGTKNFTEILILNVNFEENRMCYAAFLWLCAQVECKRNALKILIIIELYETYSARSLRAQSVGGLSNNLKFDSTGESLATENCFGSKRLQ